MKRIYFLLLSLSLAGSIFAQENKFLLYSFKGNVSVVENKVESKAKIGKMLAPSAVLKIAAGGSASLICDEASMFTLKKPGTYTLSQFTDSCEAGSSSITTNYIKYVWSQLTSHGEGTPGSNRKMFMNTVGAVSRSINNIWIDPRLDTVNYSGGEFPLSWKSYSDAKDFEFFLYNNASSNDPVFKTTVEKLKLSIPSFLNKLQPGNTYFWTAAVKGEDNDELKVLNYVTKAAFETTVNSFKAQGNGIETPAEQAYRVAFMLEDAHYLSEAYQYYLKAATSAPDNALYRYTLMSFKKDYEIK